MTAETPISEREREILRLVAMGATNQQIAQQLDISINTVKVHLRNIFGKIGVASRTEATVYAIREGLVVVDARQAAGAAEALLPSTAEPARELAAVAELEPAALAPLDAPPAPAPAPDAAPAPEAAALPVEREAAARPARWRWVGALALALLLLGAGTAYVLRTQGAGGAAEPAEGASAAPSRWRTRASLPRARTAFGVAGFDGRLYVVGGDEGGRPSAAVDRYDPANDIWVGLPDKPTPASHVGAVAIGRTIYVPGGEGGDGRPLDVLEAYDPRSQEWERLPPMPAPRSRYALVSHEGRLYLFGGWDGARYCGDVFIYDPDTRTWARDDQQMPTPRRDAAGVVVEGWIYVVGGEGERGGLRANERYDASGDSGKRWESLAPLAQPVAQPGAVGMVDVALVFDAAQRAVLQYTPASDSWAQVALPEGVPVSSRAMFIGTSVFVFGGPGGDALSEYRALFNTFLPGTTNT